MVCHVASCQPFSGWLGKITLYLLVIGSIPRTIVVTAGDIASNHGFGEAVIPIADADFLSATKGPTFVMYYADWCGHCKRMAPDWTRLAEKRHNTPLTVARLIAPDNRDNPGTEFVPGFPTFLFIWGGKVVGKYEGDRKLESLERFADGMLKLGTHGDSPEVIQAHHKFVRQYKKTVEKQETIRARKEVEALLQIEELEREFEESVAEVTDANYYMKTRNKHTLLYAYADWCEKCKKIMPNILDLATTDEPKGVQVLRLKGTEYKAHPAGRFITSYPTIVLIGKDGNVLGIHTEEYDHSVKTLRKWAETFPDMTKEERKVTTQELEKRWAEQEKEQEEEAEKQMQKERKDLQLFLSSVLELTDLNFAYLTAFGDTAVFYYSESCGYCIDLMPIWSQLVATQDTDHPIRDSVGNPVQIARIFGSQETNNPGFKFVDRYPTLLYFRNGEVINRWNGERDRTSIAGWVAKIARDPTLSSKHLLKEEKEKQEEERRRQQEYVNKFKKAKEEEIRKAKLEERKSKRAKRK